MEENIDRYVLVRTIETYNTTKKMKEYGVYNCVEELTNQYKSDIDFLLWECTMASVCPDYYLTLYWSRVCPLGDGNGSC